MIFVSPRQAQRAFCVINCIASFGVALRAATPPHQAASPAQDSAKQSSEQGPAVRIPRQQAQTSAALDGVVRDAGGPGETRPIPAAVLTLRNAQSGPAPPLLLRASSEFFLCRRATTNFASKPRIMRRWLSPTLPCNQTKS